MRPLFISSIHEEIRHFSHSWALHWLVWFFPLIIFLLLNGLFSAGAMVDLPLGVVDKDKSHLSRQLIRELDAGSHAKVINYDTDLSKALESIQRSKTYGLLYIPLHFERDVLAAKMPVPKIYYNAIFYGAGMNSVIDYVSLISELNTQYRTVIAAKLGLGVPPLASVALNYSGLFDASNNYIYYQQFSAIVHLLQLFVVTCTIYVLSRLPNNQSYSFTAIFGRLIPYSLLYTAVLIFEIAIMVYFSGARVNNNPLYMILIGFFYVCAAHSIGVLLYAITKNSISAFSLVGILVGIALTFSGISIPELAMSQFAVMISHIEPLTYALNALFDVFLRETLFINVLKTCAILSLYPIIILFLIRKKLFNRIQAGEAPL